MQVVQRVEAIAEEMRSLSASIEADHWHVFGGDQGDVTPMKCDAKDLDIRVENAEKCMHLSCEHRREEDGMRGSWGAARGIRLSHRLGCWYLSVSYSFTFLGDDAVQQTYLPLLSICIFL